MNNKKKIKLIDLKAAMGILKNGDCGKIEKHIKGKRLTAEAARWCLDRHPYSVMCYIKDSGSYRFDELFSSFEDYIKSECAFQLMEEGESGIAFEWFTDYPKNSDESRSLRDRLDERSKVVLFKNTIFRSRASYFVGEIRERYLNNFDFQIETIKENIKNLDSEDEVYEFYIRWATCISIENLNKVTSFLGREKTVSQVYMRTEGRLHTRELALPDIQQGLRYIKLYGNSEKDKSRLLYLVDCAFSSFYNSKAMEAQLFMKSIYDEFFSSVVKESVIQLHDLIRTGYSRTLGAICLYEDNEDVINNAFLYSVKAIGYNNTFDSISNFHRACSKELIRKVRITKKMEEVSMSLTMRVEKLMIAEEVTSAQELIDLIKKVSFSEKIDVIPAFDGNEIILDKMDIQKFEDFYKIEELLEWEKINEYFSNRVVPVEFLEKNKKRIRVHSFMNYPFIEATEVDELVKIATDKQWMTDLNRNAISSIIQRAVETPEANVPIELLSKLFYQLGDCPVSYSSKRNANVKMVDILKYI